MEVMQLLQSHLQHHRLHFCVSPKDELTHGSKPYVTIPNSIYWDSKSHSICTIVASYVNAGPTVIFDQFLHILYISLMYFTK